MRSRARTLHLVIAAAVIAVLTAGCSAGLDNLPLPAPGQTTSGYRLSAQFANALNLPTKAKVRLDGVDVGEVESMRASSYSAVVDMKIRDGVQIPRGTVANLRSATPLGDVFVALEEPAGASSGPALAPGSVIRQTSSAATIEDVLSRSALLVNGGAIRDLARTLNGLGRRIGGRGDALGDLIAQSTRLVDDLAARTNSIQAAITSTDQLSSTVARQQRTVDDALSAASPALSTLGGTTDGIVDIADRLGSISAKLQRFPVMREGAQGSMARDINNLAAGLNAAATQPGVDLNNSNKLFSILAGRMLAGVGAAADVDVAGFSLGPVPVGPYPANPESRVPDGRDVANLVGSLTYTLQRLRDKVIGPGR
ncbi:MlaD family protein [uncultured Williamsia sp.]|uniref:MlaD family protein n=1 Tax=uncultured Williamsia sp. TaxID=259311 RepID=UPI00260F098C|nr:MCE family protein [uncultured Williamsia sp.]